MATAKFNLPYLKASEVNGETIEYNLDEIIDTDGLLSPVSYEISGSMDPPEITISGTALSVPGQKYMEDLSIKCYDDSKNEAYCTTNVYSYVGKFNSPGALGSKTDEFANLQLYFEDYLNGTYVPPKESKFTFTTLSTKDFFVNLGSTTGYIRLDFWDGVSQIIGDGTAFDEETYAGIHSISKSIDIFDGFAIRSTNVYSCDSEGIKSGELKYGQLLSECQADSIEIVAPELLELYLTGNQLVSLTATDIPNLETLWLNQNNSLDALDITGLTKIKNLNIQYCGFTGEKLDNLILSLANSTTALNGNFYIDSSAWSLRTSLSDDSVSTLSGMLWNIPNFVSPS